MNENIGNIVVMSFSGNVGKSTLIRHLFMPRLPGYTLKEVESINTSGNTDAAVVHGMNIGKHLDDLILSDNTIFDVGASNVEAFIDALKVREGAHEDIALFVVPATPDEKQKLDAVNTVSYLLKYGTDPSKICVIFNLVPPALIGDDIAEQFKPFFRMKKDYPAMNVSVENAVYKNELFNKLTRTGYSVAELASDETDYKAMIAKETDEKVKAELAKKLTFVRMSKAIEKELDKLFERMVKHGRDS